MAEATEKSRPLPGGAPSAVKSEETDTVAVKLVLDGEIADDVVIRGSWDDWSRDWQLERNKKTLENRFCLDLPCGYYEYKYRGGRRWFCDKSKPMVRNAFGTHNNYMEVKKVPESASPLVQGLRSKVAHANMKIQKKVDLEILPSGKDKKQEEIAVMDVEKQFQDTDEFETLENDLEVKKVSDDVSTNKVAHVSVRIEKKIDLETVDIEEPGSKLEYETKRQDETSQDKKKTQESVDVEILKASECSAQTGQETEATKPVHGTKEGSTVSDPSLALVQTEKDDIVFISNDRKSDIKALIETAKQDVNEMEAALYNMAVLHADMVEYKSVLQTVEKSEEEGDLDATGKIVSAGRIHQDLKKNLEEEASKEKVPLSENEGQTSVTDSTERTEQKAYTETSELDKITEKPVHPREDLDFAIIPLPDEKDDATVQDICGGLDERVCPEMTSPTSATSSSNGWIVVDELEDEATPHASVQHESVEEVIQHADEILEEISITETTTDETIVATQGIAYKVQDTCVIETTPSDKTTENGNEMLKESSTTEAPLDETVMTTEDVVDNLQDTATGEAPSSENTVKIADIKMVEQMEDMTATEASSTLEERVKDVAPAVGGTEVKLVWKGESRGVLYVQGSWDGWRQAHKLTKSEGEVQSVTLTLPVGLHEYKFRTGNNWFHDETKPTMLNAFRTLNNILQVSGETSEETISLEVTMPDDTLEATDLCTKENNDFTKAPTLAETTGDVVSAMVVMEDKMSSQKPVSDGVHQKDNMDFSMLQGEKADATVQDVIEESGENITAELKPAEDPTSTDSENNGWTVVDNSEDEATTKPPESHESVQKLIQEEVEMFEISITETDETVMGSQDVVDKIQDTAISAKPPTDKTTEKDEMFEDISMMPTEKMAMDAQDITVKIQHKTISETTPLDQPTDKASISIVEMIEDMAAIEILPLEEADVVLGGAQVTEETCTVSTSSPVNMTEIGSSEVAEKSVNTTKGETKAPVETAGVEAPIARMSDEMAKVAVSSALKISGKLSPEILASKTSDTMVPVEAAEVVPTTTKMSEETDKVATSSAANMPAKQLPEILETTASKTMDPVETAGIETTIAKMSEEMAKVTITSSAVEMSAKPLSKHADTSTTEAAETAAVGGIEVKLTWNGETRDDVFVQGSWDGWRQSYNLTTG
ncbi:uncharacterized protein LOC118404356 [Branchiostoma floridae]|uniref:5'-AMP-activated protein kinase subunit beta-1 n=1 Tax=Branchiostoma floridae TaxID=7739 RepID=A0A9J7HGP3_BRAFL|nr:uncharacterized protein LOC118404356 [Branchiostoma floridae]